MTGSTDATLHVVTPPDPARGGTAAGELLYAAIAASAGKHDRTLILGTSVDRHAAMILGVREPLLAPPPRHPFFAGSTIRRSALATGSERIRLWSRELLASAPACRRDAPVEARLFDLPGEGDIDPWRPTPRSLSSLDRLLVPDDLTRERWGGVAGNLVEVESPPPISPATDRESARSRLGLGDSITLAPLSADPRRVDARALTFVSGVLELMGNPHTLILPARCKRSAPAVRFRRRTRLRTRFVLVRQPLLAALPAADVLIAPAWNDEPGPARSMLESHAADLGIPVASIAGWQNDPGLAHGTLSPAIRENVGPVIAAYKSVCPRPLTAEAR